MIRSRAGRCAPARRLRHDYPPRCARRYLAVVEGRLPSDRGELTHHLERQGGLSRVVPQPSASSREARLAYQVQEIAGGRNLVTVELLTGRKHQSRLQLAHIGCPVVGYVRYGSQAPLAAGPIALLAREIRFEHPTRRELLSYVCPLPVGWPWPAAHIPDNAPLWNWEDLRPNT